MSSRPLPHGRSSRPAEALGGRKRGALSLHEMRGKARQEQAGASSSTGAATPRMATERRPASANAWFRTVVLAGLALASTACVRGCTSSQPPIHVNPNMDLQPKYKAQSESEFFYDGSTMRAPVPGTIARGELREDKAFFEGKDAAGQPLAQSPVEATPELQARGAERFHIYCAPCHDARGDGTGILATRGNVPTTSMHVEKVQTATDGHLFDVITNGLGLMPAYRWPIPPGDRWAIVAHVRELQRTRKLEASQP